MIFSEESGNLGENKAVRRMVAKQGAFAGTEIVHPQTPEKTLDSKVVAEMVSKHRNAGGKIIYEIGFGGLFTANLNSYDLSVGVDPMMSSRVSARGLEDKMYAERLFFNQPVSELPQDVYPDFVIMVAPSPEMASQIFDELDSKIGGRTKVALFVENQSRQAVNGAASDIVEEARERFANLGKRVEIETDAAGLDDDFSEYLQRIGLRAGGELKTTPWEGSGDWMVVTAV